MYEEEDYQERAKIKKYVIQITQMSLFIKEITHSIPRSLYIFRLEYFHARVLGKTLKSKERSIKKMSLKIMKYEISYFQDNNFQSDSFRDHSIPFNLPYLLPFALHAVSVYTTTTPLVVLKARRLFEMAMIPKTIPSAKQPTNHILYT